MANPGGSGFPFRPLDWAASPHDFGGDNQLGIYQDEATQRFIPGTRFTGWDGRVFKYSKSKSVALLAGRGAANYSSVVNISVTLPTIAAGDRTAILPFASGDGVAANGVLADKELVGGYLVTGHAGAVVMNRLIVDTDGIGVSGTGGSITLTFDGPFSDALTTPFTEVVLNPYRYLGVNEDAHDYQAVMCVPAAVTTATYYFWGQTWGPCWVTPGGADNVPGNSVNDRALYFVGDGTVNGGTVIDALSQGHQLAGFLIDETANGTGGLPLVMLQISI